MNHDIQLVSPFPKEHYATLFSWMREFPESSFDDAAPKTADGLATKMIAGESAGQKYSLVLYRGEPVGAIGYLQISSAGGIFKGICFTRSVHGSGVPLAAVSMFLEEVFQSGTETVVAIVFADNLRIRGFLPKLGAVGVFSELPSAKRDGESVRLRAYRIRADDFLEMHRLRVRQGVPDATGVLGGMAR